MGAFVNLDARQSARLRRHVAVLGDEQHALLGYPERIMGTEGHAAGCLAYGGGPNPPRTPCDGCAQCGGRAVAAFHAR